MVTQCEVKVDEYFKDPSLQDQYEPCILLSECTYDTVIMKDGILSIKLGMVKLFCYSYLQSSLGCYAKNFISLFVLDLAETILF